MTAWWAQLQPRQQRLLLGAGLILLSLLLYVQVWEPLAAAREAERERVAQSQALLYWLEALTPTVQTLRRDSRRAEDLGGRSLLGLVDETARAAGLAGGLNRIEPVGDGQVRVWLEQVDFVATMNWLQRLSADFPIEVQQLSVDRGARSGQVNVRVSLAAGA